MKPASMREVFQHPQAQAFSVLLLLIGAAVEVARIVRDTFFISTAGAASIPWAYVIFAIVMVLSSFVYAQASRRVNLGKLAGITIALALISLLIEYFLIQGGMRNKILAYAVSAR